MLSSSFLSTLPARRDQGRKDTLIRPKEERSQCSGPGLEAQDCCQRLDKFSVLSQFLGCLECLLMCCQGRWCPALLPDPSPALAELSINQSMTWGGGANPAPGWPSNWKFLLRGKAHGGLIDGGQGQHMVLTLPASWGSYLTHNGILGGGNSTCVFLNLFCLSVFLCLSLFLILVLFSWNLVGNMRSHRFKGYQVKWAK